MLTPPAALHSLLFAAGEPMSKKEAAKLLDIRESELAAAIKALEDSLTGSGVVLVESDDMLELRTAPEASALVKKLRESELSKDLGKASLETLSVIAYRAGTTRSEVDWVRGVNSSASLRTLLLRGLIEGKEDPHDKRRIRYSLTTDAYGYLGVKNAKELPRAEELMPMAEEAVQEEARAAEADSES